MPLPAASAGRAYRYISVRLISECIIIDVIHSCIVMYPPELANVVTVGINFEINQGSALIRQIQLHPYTYMTTYYAIYSTKVNTVSLCYLYHNEYYSNCNNNEHNQSAEYDQTGSVETKKNTCLWNNSHKEKTMHNKAIHTALLGSRE